MLKAVSFDEFSWVCPYAYSYEDEKINNYYNCNHPKQRETETVKSKEEIGLCYCFSCPLGIEAEQQDLTDKTNPDAIQDEIDWDGLCEDGVVEEGEILLVEVGETATEEQKEAMWNYEVFTHRYDDEWLTSHGVWD